MDYGDGKIPKPLLTDKSARVIVTMGMPAMLYRWVHRAHSLKALERSILSLAGVDPVRHSIIGAVDGEPEHRRRWIDRIAKMGEDAT